MITLTLDEGTLDMMLDDELTDDFYDVRWHRHGFDKVAPASVNASPSAGSAV